MKKWLNWLLAVLSLVVSLPAWAEQEISRLNMTPGVTPISQSIYTLHMLIFYVCIVIGIVVFAALIYSLIEHRKSKGEKPADFHSSLSIEILWAVIPFIILILMAIPATKVLIAMNDTSKPDINIKVTGYQWKWQYQYLDYDIQFFSNLATPQEQRAGKNPKGQWYLLEVDHPLVVPINKKIRFLVTSNDVIHSWWVPALGIKRDAIPGFIYEAWATVTTPGIYRGQCAELCGVGHGFMPIVVEAKTQADFDKWVAENAPSNKPAAPAAPLTPDALMSEGQQVYNTTCSVCHKTDGSGMPPAFPAMRGSKVANGPVQGHIDIVFHGKPGTAMQPFGPQLTDEQIAAVITYERNSWGNGDKSKFGKQAGGVVQPADINKERNK
ncbi:MAG: cytochrome c oxidase subunit II [Proteobacteria bacterium]|nr:cytochrome c oxidase subunit II [Pseudomonadota bacterium]